MVLLWNNSWNNWKNNTLINSIIIPNSIEKIESGAFWNCKSLTSISIPAGVKEISITGTIDKWGINLHGENTSRIREGVMYERTTKE